MFIGYFNNNGTITVNEIVSSVIYFIKLSRVSGVIFIISSCIKELFNSIIKIV